MSLVLGFSEGREYEDEKLAMERRARENILLFLRADVSGSWQGL